MSSSSFSRAGAIDLSALAARAKTPPAVPGRGSGGAARLGSGSSYVLEVTEQTFEAETIRRSLKHPVVVELYSPRVASGQQLSDALAAIANAAGGKFLLARLNIDTAPGIVQALQLEAVPTVLALIGGRVAPLFQGVLPQAEVQAAIDQLLAAALSNGIVGRAEPVGGPATGEVDDEPVADPRFAAADEALERGDFAGAVEEFDQLLALDPNDAEAKAGRAQAGLFARAAALDPQAAIAAAASSDALAAQLDAADVEMLSGLVEEAFGRLLGLVRTRAGAERDTARVRLLELFETLGNTDDRVLKGRRQLMAALF
ncbi:tetratricopeptide repeat protein [uncultured Friedmanniella sp.]|uniref:tetratricopeptide repeat protein n=1 Tax=uncultured Friedmanniella sp. TaxID=335381 RepID=UPI0035CBCD56